LSEPTTAPRNITKADIYELSGEPPMVVKDYSRRGLLVRLYGRFCLRNEEKALRRLAGVEGVPEFCGRLGPCSLAMERIEGESLAALRRSDRREAIGPEFLDRLRALFLALEERGVFHADPHMRNILRDAQGRPWLVDFSFCYFRGALPLLDRWLVRNLQTLRERQLAKVARTFLGVGSEDDVAAGVFFRAMLGLGRLRRRLQRALRHIFKTRRK